MHVLSKDYLETLLISTTLNIKFSVGKSLSKLSDNETISKFDFLSNPKVFLLLLFFLFLKSSWNHYQL